MDINSLLASFASAFDQNNRLLSLDIGTDQHWDGVLLPQQVEGSEAVSDSYRYLVDCLSPDATLELKQLLGLPARLAIRDQNGAEVVRTGVITSAEAKGSDGGFARYTLTIEPPFALLKLRSTSRVFQDLSVIDIVKQILAEHQANNPVFAKQQTLEFHLSGRYEPRSYTLQYRESDYDFIVRLLHEEGLAWRFEHKDGDLPQVALVVFDDPYSLPQSSQERVRYHRSDATETEDGLSDWQSTRQVVPGKVSIASYDYKASSSNTSFDQTAVEQGNSGNAAQSTLEQYDAPGLYYASDADSLSHYARLRQQANDAQAKSFQGTGTARGLIAGQWFRLDDHPAHESDSAEQREFVVTKQSFSASNNLPSDLQQAVGYPVGCNRQRHYAKDAAPFTSQFEAQRRGIPLTPSYANTALAKPSSNGVQTATVVGPSGEEVHTDEQGRIKVQFHWQRADEHPTIGANLDDKSSCWVRVAMPSAGHAWGHQFIPRIGQEVLVDFIEGDIDRPLVTGVLYNGSHATPDFSGAGSLPANKTLSGIKSKEHQGSNYNELLFDDTQGQVRTKLSSEHGKTQLNQGYLTQPRTDGKADPRGEGFELRSDLQGAIRAAQGVLVSAAAQNNANGWQMARDELLSQLQQALALAKQLSQTSQAQQADNTETSQQEQLKDSVKHWDAGSNVNASGQKESKAIIAVSAPAGIAIASQSSITIAAGSNHDLVAAQDSNFSIGQNLRMRVKQTLSIFVEQLGMKLIAASGKVQIQAQNNQMEIGSAKLLHLYSLEEIKIEAPKVTIVSQGAGAEWGGGNLTTNTTGTHTQKAASHQKVGPAASDLNLKSQPFIAPKAYSQRFWFKDAIQGDPSVAGSHYKVLNDQGEKLASGQLDSSGATQTIFTDQAQNLHTYVGSGEWTIVSHQPNGLDSLEDQA